MAKPQFYVTVVLTSAADRERVQSAAAAEMMTVSAWARRALLTVANAEAARRAVISPRVEGRAG